MISVRILDMRPHPCQATHNPGTWAVQFEISRNKAKRTFWRWYTKRDKNYKAVIAEPSSDDVLREFWDETFADLHGFDFDVYDEVDKDTP